MNNLPESRQSEVVVQELENEVLIYDLRNNNAYCLNETSAVIWRMCDGTKTVAEISRESSRKTKTNISEDVVWLAIDNLKEKNLLENNDEFAIDFRGLNRRQIIRQIGLASMIALPVILSIVAPSATMAASGTLRAACESCTSNSQCANNRCLNNVCSNGSSSFAPGTPLGGAAAAGFCSTPGAADNTCTTIRGNLCCSGTAKARSCNQSDPDSVNAGTYSVSCYCA